MPILGCTWDRVLSVLKRVYSSFTYVYACMSLCASCMCRYPQWTEGIGAPVTGLQSNSEPSMRVQRTQVHKKIAKGS